MKPWKPLLSLLLIAPLTSACSQLPASRLSPERVVGAWTGTGRFLDRKLAAEHGEFPLEVQVHEDGSVTGTIGAARMERAELECRRDDYLVAARLEGAVFDRGTLSREDKDCVALLLQPVDTAHLEGNAHLKTNFTFDPRMRVCGLALVRER